MSRYAAAHANPQGAGDARPTAMQIVQDEGLVGKMTDKVVVITGASAGIGAETARAFHATGATLFLTVRNLAKGQAVVDDILSTSTATKPTPPIHLIPMSLDSLASVRSAATQILSRTKTLNILILNAGIMACPYTLTEDGFESQFGTNHLGHFLLFQLLKPLLLSSTTPAFQSRVVSVSSFGHREGPIRFDDYNFNQKSPSGEPSYTPWAGYGQSKTANIYLASAIERRYSRLGLHALSLHPGGIKSDLQVHVKDMMAPMWELPEVKRMEKTAAQGASTSVFAAVGRDWEGKGGVYLSDCAVQGRFRGKVSMAIDDDGYAEWIYDAEKEDRLWRDSLKMVGLKEEEDAEL